MTSNIFSAVSYESLLVDYSLGLIGALEKVDKIVKVGEWNQQNIFFKTLLDFKNKTPGMCNILGHMYYYGKGVERDVKLAKEWFLCGAEYGDKGAKFNLGVMFYGGCGIERNVVNALIMLGEAKDSIPKAKKYYDKLVLEVTKEQLIQTVVSGGFHYERNRDPKVQAKLPKSEILLAADSYPQTIEPVQPLAGQLSRPNSFAYGESLQRPSAPPLSRANTYPTNTKDPDDWEKFN